MVGVSVIEVVVGMNDFWYNFCVGILVYVFKIFNVYKLVLMLFLSNDYIGYSEFCILFFDFEYCKDKNGFFLLKVCFLFIVVFC